MTIGDRIQWRGLNRVISGTVEDIRTFDKGFGLIGHMYKVRTETGGIIEVDARSVINKD